MPIGGSHQVLISKFASIDVHPTETKPKKPLSYLQGKNKCHLNCYHSKYHPKNNKLNLGFLGTAMTPASKN